MLSCCILQRMSRIQKTGMQATCGQQAKNMPQLSTKTLPQPKANTQTFTFIAEQLTKFAADVVIQIAQPPTPKKLHNKSQI